MGSLIGDCFVEYSMSDSSGIEVEVSEDDLSGQVARMEEAYEWDVYEAERHYNEVRGMVVDALEEFEYEWSTDVIDAFTHLLLSVQIQMDEKRVDEETISIKGYMEQFREYI